MAFIPNFYELVCAVHIFSIGFKDKTKFVKICSDKLTNLSIYALISHGSIEYKKNMRDTMQ